MKGWHYFKCPLCAHKLSHRSKKAPLCCGMRMSRITEAQFNGVAK